jgi:hypothetical protein
MHALEGPEDCAGIGRVTPAKAKSRGLTLRSDPGLDPGERLDPGIHAVTAQQAEAPMEWISGLSPAMTSSIRGD